MEQNKKDYYKLSPEEKNNLEKIDKQLPSLNKIKFIFGTCGFRYNEIILDKIIYRSGIMVSLLSMSKNSLPLGISITGGHNIFSDNGIKIAGENGHSLTLEEEKYFEEIANSENLSESIDSIIYKLKPTQGKSIIIIGIDTRPSSKRLCELIIKGLKNINNCSYNVYNVIPTPSLYLLTLLNQMAFRTYGLKHKMVFIQSNNYWEYLNHTFKQFNSFYEKVFPANKQNKEYKDKYEHELCIDCDNGVASLINKNIENIFYSNNFPLKVSFINNQSSNFNELNNNCRTDYIQKYKIIPINKNEKYPFLTKLVSFNCDLSSIIYYFYDNINDNIKAIQGEKIFILFAKMIDFLVENFSPNLKIKYYEYIKMGIVTNSYSNSSFITFCKDNLSKFNLSIVKTGIKYLQQEAEKYDLCIYFEPNGHGSIYISKEINGKFGKLSSLIETSKDSQIIELFQLFIAMFNTTTSDGLSLLFAIESTLKAMNLTLVDIYNYYEELPFEIINIKVKDKMIFMVNNDDEAKLSEPKELHDKINELKEKFSFSKIFIRPSGTEDLLRIYVESNKSNKIILKEIQSFLKNYQ